MQVIDNEASKPSWNYYAMFSILKHVHNHIIYNAESIFNIVEFTDDTFLVTRYTLSK